MAVSGTRKINIQNYLFIYSDQ